ncbi:hypothetical protein AC1031_007212 [Aphanomyces cochlioides]|nr:hypothetical protein AC1031_007212 [Aphanomyces cochlioides]
MEVHMTWEDEAWLDFLPPVDETLLGSAGGPGYGLTQSIQSQSKALVAPQKGPKRVNMLKVELLSLQQEKQLLERQLAVLESKRSVKRRLLTEDEKKWQQIAQKQLELKLRAEREHKQLREILAEQVALKREMESIVLKKPQLMMMKVEDERWRLLKLSVDPTRRTTEIQSIANRQLDNIDNDMLSLNMMDSTNDIKMYRHDSISRFSEGIHSMKLQASSFAQVEAALWTSVLQMHATYDLHYHIHRYSIDDDTFYVRKSYTNPKKKSKVQSRMVLKRQRVGSHTLRIVFRSILDDDEDPFEPGSIPLDAYGWIHVEENKDKSFMYKCFMRGNVDVLGSDDLEHIADELCRFDIQKGMRAKMAANSSQATFEAAFETFQSQMLDQLAKDGCTVCPSVTTIDEDTKEGLLQNREDPQA